MPRDELPIFDQGAQLTAAQLNQISLAVISRIIGGAGIKATRFGPQVIINMTDEAIKRGSLTEMVIVSDEGDYLTCQKRDDLGVTLPGLFNVLKPWLLRRTPFEGLTVNGVSYTYSGNAARQADGTEDQEITQDYFAGAVIYVEQINISVAVSTGVFTRLIDSNLDGRDWGEPA